MCVSMAVAGVLEKEFKVNKKNILVFLQVILWRIYSLSNPKSDICRCCKILSFGGKLCKHLPEKQAWQPLWGRPSKSGAYN